MMNRIKRSFFQAVVVSILLYGCTTWTLTKRMEKKLEGNYTRMLRAILYKLWRQHRIKQQLYGQRQDDQLEPAYSSSVQIQDVALKTYRKRWTIEKGGGGGSRRCMLMEWLGDDDDFTRKKNQRLSNSNFQSIQVLFVWALWHVSLCVLFNAKIILCK